MQKQSEEDLLTNEFMALKRNFSQNNPNYKFKEPTFEKTDGLLKWTDPKFNEYRSFNIKSIRDIFFALLN
jgi:hypothetical protein